ncbi:MAG TPA: NAD(P)/FAD-dependent oxidoreductase [Pyrinomonadaceae bacterium]
MVTVKAKPRIVIIGAGLGGALLAIYLAKHGFCVDLYERRGDMREEPVERGRSINMTLATRGLNALASAGVLDEVMKNTIPLRGRMIHNVDGTRTFQPYGRNNREVIHSIKRKQLNCTLMDAAVRMPGVNLFFNKRCVSIDKERGSLRVRDEVTGEEAEAQADFIVGADGAFSTVRQQMHRGLRAQYAQDFLEWGYKELAIPPAHDGSHQIENDVLHIWPRGDQMLLAMPNADGSFTCTCILPFGGEAPNFSSEWTEDEVLGLFRKQFGDAIPLMPSLVEDFKSNQTMVMVTTHTSPWYYKDRVVLIGDACHAVVPFYGQGMNAAFEDCALLSEKLAQSEGQNLEQVFREYQRERKPNTDALAELSQQNFVELRKKIKSPLFVARKKVDIALNSLLPQMWVPLYTMMSHTTMPYAEAVRRFRKQSRVARLLGLDIVLLSVAGGAIVYDCVKRWGRKHRPEVPAPQMKMPPAVAPAELQD